MESGLETQGMKYYKIIHIKWFINYSPFTIGIKLFIYIYIGLTSLFKYSKISNFKNKYL